MRRPTPAKVHKRMIGRNLAAYMLVRVHMRELPEAEARRRVMRALRELAEDDMAKQTISEIEEARQTLIAMMKKR